MGTAAGEIDASHVRARWHEALVAFVGDDPGRSALASGSGIAVGVAADVVRPSASVGKLFLAIAAVLNGHRGTIDLDATVAVADLPPTRYPSVTLALAPTHRLSVIELVGLMLASSDNRVAEHVMTLVGAERATQAVRSIGCDDTTLTIGFADEHLGPAGRANLTTAIDCATALTALMTDPMFAAVRPALRSSLFNTRILSALPDNIVVSHKTGSLAGVVNDVGVVHAPGGRLTVCFLTDAQTDAATTSAAIGRCTRELFDAFIDAEVRR